MSNDQLTAAAHMSAKPMTAGNGADPIVDGHDLGPVHTHPLRRESTNGGSNSDPCSRVQPKWGKPLTETDYLTLAGSWITRDIADAAMLRRVDEYEGREIVGQKGKRDCSGILIPYYWPCKVSVFNYRIRRDHPDWTVGKDGKPKAERKYLAPPQGENRLFIPIGITTEQLRDVQTPIALKEKRKHLPSGGSPNMRQKSFASFLSGYRASGTGWA